MYFHLYFKIIFESIFSEPAVTYYVYLHVTIRINKYLINIQNLISLDNLTNVIVPILLSGLVCGKVFSLLYSELHYIYIYHELVM